MSGRNLKHYQKYLDSIHLFIDACGLKLEYAVGDNEGTYIPSKRKIRIDPELSDSYEIAVLLHELGHSLDDALVNKKSERLIDRAYRAVYAEKATFKQLDLVYKCENRAWLYGRVLARKLNIRLGKWYDEAQKDCISSYKNALTLSI